jgi:hypothetical protein
MMKRPSQAQGRTAVDDNEIVASIDRLAEDLRRVLLMIARISGALPPVPKP